MSHKPESRHISGTPSLHILQWAPAGEPLLLVHGMAGNAYWWETTAPLLADKFQVVALDFRGHGDSDWLESGRYNVDGMMEDIESARKFLGWERMHLGAHSMGARIAVGYAQKHADQLKRLVLVDFLPEFRRSMSQKFHLISRIKQPVYPSIEDMLPRFRLEPRGTELGAAALEQLAQHCIRKFENGYTWKFDWRGFDFHYGSIQSAFAAIKTKSLIVRGAKSLLMKPEVFQEVVKSIPGAQGVEIPGAYHHVPLDNPKELAERMLDFLLAKT